ncbi:unnamed protein product [Notodromas monacha]|uniref:Uncharacterized protein n=1 Tax=Notodromas monacha TaxID=399045 RepID=A0A7R9BNW2_9CRUS|nr:unnamed protein product [Notodromas monacha]CAG0917865.1 unnamed protein product [Notodromas monacha]
MRGFNKAGMHELAVNVLLMSGEGNRVAGTCFLLHLGLLNFHSISADRQYALLIAKRLCPHWDQGLLNFHSMSADRQYALLIAKRLCPHWDQVLHKALNRFHNNITSTSRRRLRLSRRHQGLMGPDDSDAWFCCGVWSPRGHGLAVVHNENSLLYFPTPGDGDGDHVLLSPHPPSGSVRNGNPDYLYTARIYGDRPAIWVNSNGSHVIYVRQNNSGVDEMSLPIFGKPVVYAAAGNESEATSGGPTVDQLTNASSVDTADDVRVDDDDEKEERRARVARPEIAHLPKWKSFHYPMVGRRCPKISVHAVSLLDGSTVSWEPVDERCTYVLEIKWINDTHAVVIWTDRKQSLYVSCLHDISHSRCKEVYRQELSEDSASWIPHSMRDGSSLFFSEDFDQMLILAQLLDGTKGYFTHVVIVDLATTRVTPVTHGPFDVHRIASWDAGTDLLYYIASPEGRPAERHLYVTKYTPRTFVDPHCLTCPPTTPDVQHSFPAIAENGLCLYADVQFSHSSSYFVLDCYGPGIPTAEIFAIDKPTGGGVSSVTGRRVAAWELNNGLRERVAKIELPEIRRFDIPVDNGFMAHVELLLPLYANTEEADIFQYPLVVAMPQEPGEQQVTEEWDEIDWLFRLSVVKRWIVMRVDLRGSGGEGRAREAEVSRNIGRAETKDLQTVIRTLLAKFSFLNPEKICLCGWGISGFYVVRALAEDGVEYFNCGIAVAPVANWMNADAYIGERIMGFPNLTENIVGYIENDVRKMSPHIQGKDLLVIHGTADSTVLLHNSMSLFRALIQKNVIFHEMIYPDEGHNLDGVTTHMHAAMETFMQNAFGVALDDEDQVTNFLAAAGFA